MSVVTAGRLRLLEFIRTPTTVGMLLVLPPVVVETYGRALASFPALPSLGGDPGTVGRITGALFAVAFLAGLVGLFQAISARAGDERLALAGYSPRDILAGRVVTMVVVAAAGAAVAAAALAVRVTVEAPLTALLALLLAGLLYGMLGVAVGALLPRALEGSLVLVFFADVDNAFASGLVASDLWITEAFPLYHPHALFEAAVVDGEVATAHLWPSLGWLLALVAVAFLAYGRALGGEST